MEGGPHFLLASRRQRSLMWYSRTPNRSGFSFSRESFRAPAAAPSVSFRLMSLIQPSRRTERKHLDGFLLRPTLELRLARRLDRLRFFWDTVALVSSQRPFVSS